jgi:hypothetical protein
VETGATRRKDMRALSIAILTVLAAGSPVRGAEEPAPVSSLTPPVGGASAARVLEELEQNRPQTELSPEVLANLINKGEIAERTMQRAVGLREAGNPHIPEGILLRTIQDDPSRSQVDLDRLREEQIQMVERRGLDDGRPVSLRLPAPEGAQPDLAGPPSAAQGAATNDRSLFRVAFLAASLVLVFCGVFIYLRQ